MPFFSFYFFFLTEPRKHHMQIFCSLCIYNRWNQNSNFRVIRGKKTHLMEYFFEDNFWYNCNYEAVPVSQSAFQPYYDGQGSGSEFGSDNSSNGSGSQNLNRRMIDFVRRSWSASTETKETEDDRSRRHMINERMRREKEKLNYLALHSLLPPGTKVLILTQIS